MPQQTNLNVSPYFDDFDSANDYHKVLFKPGYPIQARELTTLQSILQDQIEKFGQHFFKDGDKVIPGNTGYSNLYQCVQLNNSFQGVPVSAYADQLIGSKITGQSSGVTAYVDYVLFPEDSERGSLTLYVNYLGSSTQNNSTQTFSDGEFLISNQVISSGLLGNTTIQAGSPFASTISNSSAATGSSFSIDAGVYFIRGSFVTVDKETLVLDQYSNTPSYRVGLFINEEIVTSDSDESLNDNSQGFNNYSAPGADRLKISVSLTKKQLDDFDDTNFVELATVIDGVLKSKKVIGGSISSGNGGFRAKDVSDTLARRTYAESGDYYVKPFGVTYLNSLNDNVGNGGIFNSTQFTPSGGTPSDDLGVYKISPGKAFVRGYEIDVRSPIFLDAPKPRTEKVVEGQSLFYNTGTTLKLNRVFRSPTVGLGNDYTISLRSDRVGEDVDADGAPGEEIGLARVYDFRLESGAYELSDSNANIWGISLYDVQIFTKLTLNQSINLSAPTFIRGKNSGATAFIKDDVTDSNIITIYQVSGSFVKNESLIFDGVENGRIITDIIKNKISDVKSLFGTTDGVVGINTFSADTVQSASSNTGTATISKFSGEVSTLTVSGTGSGYTDGTYTATATTSTSSGTGCTVTVTVASGTFSSVTVVEGGQNYAVDDEIVIPAVGGGSGLSITVSDISNASSSITSSDSTFLNKVNVGSLLQYSDLSVSQDPIVSKIVSIENSTVSVVGVTTVSGIANGKLPDEDLNVTDLKILTTKLSESSDNTLFTRLGKNNVSTVNISGASITIRKSYTIDIVGNEISSTTIPTSGDNEIFLPFTSGRYSLMRSDGSTEILTSDKFAFSADLKTVQISNLSADDVGSTLIATLRKSKPKSKVKRKNRVNSVLIDKSKYSASGTGESTLNDGLQYGDYPFGTRVQDEMLSLNVPDIIDIHGIFESSGTEDPSSPRMDLSSLDTFSTTTNDLLLGEILVGQTSGAVAVYVEKISDSIISFVYKNDIKFIEGETVSFQESLANGVAIDIESPSFEISSEFSFSTGQQKSFYNYGYVKRKSDFKEPTKKVKIYFTSAFYSSDDDGDITTINSYDSFDYSKEIKSIDAISNSDIVDIRPRTSNYEVEEGKRSPFEFMGRSFSQLGNSSSNILASNETLLIDYSYFLGRIDRIFLTKGGKFQVVYGTPSEKPERPINIDDALEVATVELPPFLYNTRQASIEFLEYKRYRMSDIRSLERRIKNLEFYTSLSILETNTANMYIPDSEGTNRLKTGFFVDNFSSFKTQETSLGMKNSIDRTLNELRPNHFTDSIDLIDGPVANVDPSQDLLFSGVEGNNVRKNNNILTLNYSELEWSKQPFATRSESVTPFLMNFWQGTIDLTPASDNWIDPVKLEAKIIKKEGNYAETLANAVKTLNVDPQTGFAPAIWDGWKENWTGKTRTRPDTRTRQSFTSDTFWRDAGGGMRDLIERTHRTTIQEELSLTVESGTSTNTGLQTTVVEDFEETSIGEKVVGKDIVPYMRSRNVQFVSKRLKPLTKVFAFFDGVDVTKFCVPKLLEISMISGVFEVGELVEGVVQRTGLDEDTRNTSPKISFRAAQLNHKEGPYNSPTKVFQENPYTNNTLSSTYSSTSSIMNVDTFSLSNEVQGEYFGWVGSDMVLTGKSSGAQATITNVRLLTDLSSTLIGSFFIPDPKNANYPKFETGTKNFKLINDADNDQNLSTTSAEESYIASGIIEKTQETIISVRNAKVEQKPVFDSKPIERTLNTEIVSSAAIGPTITSGDRVVRTRPWSDPLAQSFLVEEDGGIFLTKCDIFFRSVDDMDIPVTLQIRTMNNGTPTQIIVPNSEVVLDPGDIDTSSDSSVATTFQFKSPIYLEGNNTDYCICLLSVSTKYSVYISRMGETDLISDVFVSNPNKEYMGSLFKSQNGSTWEPSQWEDLKYTLYRADFIESGSVDLYNPELSEGNKKIATLMPNSLSFNSRKIRLGLSREVDDSYQVGNTFTQDATNASGNLISVASKATGDLIVTNVGIGYTPSSGQFVFDDVSLTAISGDGRGASADITVENGSITNATIVNGGSGYQIGDVLSIDTIGNSSVGRNCRLSIATIGDPNELILDNVQGEFVSGSSNSLFYTNNLGNLVELDESNGGGVLVSSVNVDSDGLHVKVNHKNHGMYFEDNLVKIAGAQSDIKPTKLITPYQIGSVGSISVEDASQFSSFENVGIGTTNIGLIRIGDEIIEYTDVTGNNIGGNIVRGSTPKAYPVGTPVFKYELNGISLERINKTHDLSQVTIKDPITFDSYHIKLDTSNLNTNNDDRSDNIGYPKLYANQTKSAGGYNIKASQNMPFEIITPMVENVTVNGTSLTGQVRTTTSQSLSGNEIAFVDAGFEPVVLNESNYLSSPRMICSKVNENSKLNSISGNKSMNLRLFLNTTNSAVSPVIDLERVNAILTSNRVNSVIDDYSTDSRVNTIDGDPTSCQYISKEISLENAADSIKIMLNAHISTDNDIRAFYAVSDTSGFEPIFQPFPGHENLDSRGQVISEENSNGESDSIVPKTIFNGFDSQSLDFKEYTFTADSLPPFRSYRIKIIMTSNSQVHVPRMKDLRVITMI